MKKYIERLVYAILLLSVVFVSVKIVSAVVSVDCYNTVHTASESACETDPECYWRTDAWGSWCEERNCWSFYTEGECAATATSGSSSFINKTCSWTNSSQGWCTQTDCWSFDGTSASACESNGLGIQCTWADGCVGPPEKGCWNKTTQASCQETIGCDWGMCTKQDCWSQTSSTACATATGFSGNPCVWNSQYGYCYETGCWDNANKTGCESDGNCTWSGSSCYKRTCSDFSNTNATTCEIDNFVNMSCTYDNSTNWCSEKGCWNYNAQDTCGNAPNCIWETYSGGWCEETRCWSFDTQGLCENVTDTLDCAWDDPWCFENATAKTCTTITNERDCMDTYYCYWDFTAGTCNEPTGAVTTIFEEWNPGCYIFDTDENTCENSTACWWNTTSLSCINNATIEFDDGVTTSFDGKLNCSYITNQSICDNIPALSTCCTWQAGTCTPDRFDQSCKTEMEEPPEGCYYCEDYVAYTNEAKCKQITGYPWYMPCEWNNVTERCGFKNDKIFSADEEKNIMKIDNKRNCESAGGIWQVEKYCESSNTLSTGRCELKFDEERNCDKECYACDYKTDKTNWSSAEEAKLKCIESKLSFCKFTNDTSAPNAYGYCRPRDEVKNGLASTDCDSDCSACNYMGDATASKPEYRPSYFCKNSEAKCKWVADPANPTDESKGKCASKAEKTCEDRCDKCYTQTNCQTYGAKEGNASADLAAQCEWVSGMCKYKTGADQWEICWDGIDNNNDGKMDCADSMCWSDPFCGGSMMFGTFGVDCFGYTTESTCNAASGTGGNCTWINENWGSWCDMPGAACWKQDGTNESYCEVDWHFGLSNDTCEWHSGFGGFCESNWTQMDSCMGTALEDCSGDCIWVQDTWCQDSGGYCMFNGTGTWVDCAQRDWVNQTQLYCEEDPSCDWQTDSWCQNQGGSAGMCDHKSAACSMLTTNDTCENATWIEHCMWRYDDWGGGGWCEGKMMSGGSGSCWSYNTPGECSGGGCNWVSGFCDPKGFGGDMMAGMGGVGMAGSDAMGGFGFTCMEHDGNKEVCENTTGCGWSDEPKPFCDINFTSNCPKYSYSQAACVEQNLSGCMWHPEGGGGFCDEKPFECFWNSTLSSGDGQATAQEHCDANSLCNYTNGHCQPVCFAETDPNGCSIYPECNWMTGWCGPGMGAKFFGGMEMGAPVPLGFDAAEDGVEDEVDIIDYGMKDMGQAYGFGIRVVSVNNTAACNGIKVGGITITGTNTSKYYWYLDTDGNSTNNCNSSDNNQTGFEFHLTYEASYDRASGSVNEQLKRYRCSSGSWAAAEISTNSNRQKMCTEVGGAMIAMDKAELEKYSDLYVPSADMRVYVATAGNATNASQPSDYVEELGYATHGAFDFNFNAFDVFKLGDTAVAKAGKVASMNDGGFKKYSEVNCWTESGCSDWACKDHPFCVQYGYGVENASFSDTKVPKVEMMYKEAFADSALISFFTDKPANRTFTFYDIDGNCSTVNTTITSNVSELNHKIEVYNGTDSLGCDLQNDTKYYFRIKICDENNKCGESACSSFITDSPASKDFGEFVTIIQAPPGWEVYYDLDQDGDYEHHQGCLCSSDAGMKTDYNTGRRADVKLMTDDNSSYMEFVNVTLSKTALRLNTRDIQAVGSLDANTTTDSAGNTIGYAGMTEETSDKIVNNMFPEKCYIKFPKGGTSCDELWQCDANRENCVDRAGNATLNETGSDYCNWEVPCEFSLWSGGQPGTYSASTTTPTTASGTTSVGEGGYTAIDASKGVIRTMSIKDALVISLGALGGGSAGGSESHQIVLDKLTSDSVTLLIYSKPIVVVLKSGEAKKVDVDSDGILDILIELRSIDVPHRKAEIYFEDITPAKEDAPPGEEVVGIGEDVVEEKPEIPTGEVPAVPKEAPSKSWLWILIVAGLAVVAAGYWFVKKKE